MIRTGNLCEIYGGTETEALNWFVGGANWINGASAPSPYSIGTYTTTSIGSANVNIPMTITTVTSSTKKLKATWYPVQTSWNSTYTVSSNACGWPPGTTTTVSNPHPIPLPLGIHCSVYTRIEEHGYSQPNANGIVYAAHTNLTETKFMQNGTIGLIVHMENDIARMLIEEKLYLVPMEKLKVIS